ncbi:MAG: TlpA disulfide reductase family protein [Pirellulales bacterium]
MSTFHDFQRLATRRTFLGAIVALCLAISASPARADRQEDFAKLETEFEAAGKKFQADHTKENPTDADLIRNVEDYQLWPFIPRVLALAEANPEDDTAFRCCEWIITKNPGFAGDRAKFDAEQKAWAILAAHHANGDRYSELCLEAAQSASPAREHFLRDLLAQPTISKVHAGYATLVLAELLTRKIDFAEYFQKKRKPSADDPLYDHLQSRYDPAYVEYLSGTDIHTTKNEIAHLLRTVIDRYGDVPNSLSKPGFRDMKTLADKAKKSLHALEHLRVGAEAPDIVGTHLDGRPLKLAEFRGRVVVLSFWFTGCGPCMALISEERKLIEKFKDRPFSLIGICGDEDREQANKTAAEEKITWPCWFDGSTNGPIHRDYNITSWPRLYLLDQNGRIADKDVDRNQIEEAVANLLDRNIGSDSSNDTKLQK